MPITAPPPPRDTFPTTQWTVVTALRDAPPEIRRALLAEFLECYTPAFQLHLVLARGITHEQDLEDVLQGFITDTFIAKNIFEYVSRDGGRLRNYLRRCLDYYVYSQHRTKTAAAWDKRVDWENLHHDASEHEEAVADFDIAWAQTVMTEAIIRTKDQFFHGRRPLVWDVFDLCVVRPLLTKQQPVSYDDLAERFGISKKAIQNRRVTALRAFGKHLREVIAAYVGDETKAIDSEITDLKGVVSSTRFRELAAMEPGDDTP